MPGGAGWGECLFNLAYSLFYVPSFSLMFAWGWVGGPRGGTYEISAGQREARWGECLFSLA